MKKKLLLIFNWPIFLVASLMFFLILPSCQDQLETTFTYRTQIPVFMQMNAFREADIIIEPGKSLDSPGKIYIYGDFLLINEANKGIHIIDNTIPSSPVNLNFINIPGSRDLAVNNNIMYADSYVDLLTFDISDPKNIKMVKRLEDVFPQMYSDASTGTFVVYKDTLISSEDEFLWWGGRPIWRQQNEAFFSASDGGKSYGQGGSMARFTLLSEHLYAVDEQDLRVFDVSNDKDPQFLKKLNLGWGIETIFPFKDKLFIGSNTGMYIYDTSVPAEPKQMSIYQHLTACDPVVVNEDYAFVTLRSGVACRLGVDELQIIDIKDPYRPEMVKAYPMDNPHGLSLSGDYLYLAEGNFGLKSFKVGDVLNIDKNQIEHLKSIKSVDIIAGPKSLIVIGPDGVFQFDYKDPAKLKTLSCIQVKNRISV